MKTIKISFNKKEYEIKKDKLLLLLEKLNCGKVEDFEIKSLMKKFKLYDEYFLENACRL